MIDFDSQPVLQGECLRLRPLESADYNALYQVASDPKIWEQHPCMDRYQEPVFKKFFAEALESKGALLVLDSRTNQVIGSSRYYEFDPVLSQVVIGYTFLTRATWGGRYNGELKSLMIEHAFKYVDRVVFHVDLTNIRSQKAMKRSAGVELASF